MFYNIFIDMKKKLIITETQLKRLKVKLNEETQHAMTVNKIKTELNNHYEPIEKYVRKGGEYNSTTMVKNKVDEEEISIADLFSYLKHQFKIDDKNNKFLEQIITDWVSGNIGDDNTLSRNVPLL